MNDRLASIDCSLYHVKANRERSEEREREGQLKEAAKKFKSHFHNLYDSMVEDGTDDAV